MGMDDETSRGNFQSASYRSSGMLKSMSVTYMSLPYLNRRESSDKNRSYKRAIPSWQMEREKRSVSVNYETVGDVSQTHLTTT